MPTTGSRLLAVTPSVSLTVLTRRVFSRLAGLFRVCARLFSQQLQSALPDRGRGGVQGPVLVDDALPSGAHEGVGPTAAPPLGRRPRLLRPPAHQRDSRGSEQRHPERQDPRKGLQEHGLFQHDDLPDLRQTRPTNRHRLTALHPHQTAKGLNFLNTNTSVSPSSFPSRAPPAATGGFVFGCVSGIYRHGGSVPVLVWAVTWCSFRWKPAAHTAEK